MGKRLTRRMRMVGIQAQIIPTLISTVDHIETGTLSQVGLADLANVTRDWRRMILTTVTLFTC